MSSTLDSLLNLPGVTIEGLVQVEGYVCLQVKILALGINCPHCQNPTQELHQSSSILVRDLPTFGSPVYLKVPRRKFYCRKCQRYSTDHLEFIDWRRSYTQRYEENIYARVPISSIQQISRDEDLTSEEIQGIFNHVSNQLKKNDWEPVLRLSLDEIAMHKGHKDFKTVVSNIDTGKLLDVIDSLHLVEIIEVLMQQPLEVREAVVEVSVDMWGGFKKVIQEVFPNAVIVFDRFHVMKLVNVELNSIRKLVGITDKHSKYLILKNSEDLNEEQKEKLQQILSRSACLKIAHEFKDSLKSIYETSKNVKSGQKRMKKWLQLAQLFYKDSSQTIRDHLEGICNYFISRTTSGVMEGINNRIKLIMRQGYGFTNFNNFRSRLLACFSN